MESFSTQGVITTQQVPSLAPTTTTTTTVPGQVIPGPETYAPAMP